MKIRFFEQTDDGWQVVSANYFLYSKTKGESLPDFEKEIGALVVKAGFSLNRKAHGIIRAANMPFAVYVEDEGQTIFQMTQEIEDGLKTENNYGKQE